MVQENLTYFNADAESDIWLNYVGYIDDMIVEGFFNCIYCSLNYFAENMEVSLNLQAFVWYILFTQHYSVIDTA